MYKCVFSFISGVIVGAAATLLWLRGAYNKKVEDTAAEIAEKNQNNKKTVANSEPPKKDIPKNESRDTTGTTITRDFSKPLKYHDVDTRSSYKILTLDELDESQYPQKPLIYYKQDNVLADYDGTSYEDITYWLGENWESIITNAEDDEVYIRNLRVGYDLVVTIEDTSYALEFGDPASK